MTPSRLLAVLVLVGAFAAVLFTTIRSDSESDVNVGVASAADATATTATGSDNAAEAPASSTSAPGASTTTTVQPPSEAPPVLGVAGSLVELDGWLNSDYTTLEEIDSPVRIVQFWTFGCINCKRTLESLRGLYDDHQAAGLEIVGVHSPEFEREKDPAAIAAAAEDLGVNWPIALDTEKRNFRSWQGSRRFWPRTYVLDAEGNIRFDHIGEGKYDELRATVEWLLVNEA